MPHRIMDDTAFLGVRTPAWHKLGTVVEDQHIQATAAIKMIGMDYHIDTCPLFVQLPNGRMQQTTKAALMRERVKDAPWAEFAIGIDPDRFQILQNLEIAEIIDRLLETAQREHKEWHLETVGALDQGETIFLTVRMPGYDIKGDVIDQFILITDTRDAMHSVTIKPTHIRVVCANTLDAAIRGTNNIQLQHRPGVIQDAEILVNLITRTEDANQRMKMAFDEMATKQITPQQAMMIFRAAYPLPRLKKTGQIVADAAKAIGIESISPRAREIHDSARAEYLAQKARQEEMVRQSEYLYTKISDEFSQIAGTAWAAYNAIAELEDQRLARGDNDEARAYAAAARSLFGSGVHTRARAYKSAIAICHNGTVAEVEMPDDAAADLFAAV